MRSCTYCGRGGHNRRSCPALKKTIRDDPEGYYARQEARIAKARKPRKCSYCRTEGHTKRTCGDLQRDRKIQATRAKEWRQEFLTHCRVTGFGPGTLIKYLDPAQIKSEWSRDRMIRWSQKHGEYALVIDARWETLDHRQKARATTPVVLRFPSGKQMMSTLPIEFAGLMDEYAGPQFQIVGKIDSAKVGDTLSAEWHSGTDSADWHLNLY